MIQAGGIRGGELASPGCRRGSSAPGSPSSGRSRASLCQRLQRRQQAARRCRRSATSASRFSIRRRGSAVLRSPGIAAWNASLIEASSLCSLRLSMLSSAALPATCRPTSAASRIAATRQAGQPTAREVVGAYVPCSRLIGEPCGQLLCEQRERTAGQQLDLDAVEALAQRFDARRMLMPLGRPGVQDQAATRRRRSPRSRLRDLQRLIQRVGRQGDRRAPGGRTTTTSSSRSATDWPGFMRQQVAVRIHRLRLDAAGFQQRQPFIHQRACDHRDGRAAWSPAPVCRSRSAGRRCPRPAVPRGRRARPGRASCRPSSAPPAPPAAHRCRGRGRRCAGRRCAGRPATAGRSAAGPTALPRGSTTSQVAGCSGVRGSLSRSQSAMGVARHAHSVRCEAALDGAHVAGPLLIKKTVQVEFRSANSDVAGQAEVAGGLA